MNMNDVQIDFADLKKNFGLWLDENEILSTPGSIASYRSYINQLHDVYNKEYGPDSFEKIISAYKRKSKNDISKAYVEVVDFINNQKQINRKKWTDIGSGFNQFDSFLKNEFDVDGNESKKNREVSYPIISPQKITKKKKFSSSRGIITADEVFEEFSQKKLFNRFKNRLKTQSRYYPVVDLLFPVRLITDIFRKAEDDSFNEWMMSGLRNMVVLGKADDAYSFKDIEKICILKDERVKVVLKNSEEFELYTYNVDCKGVIPLRTKYMGDISIDHIKSLAEKMEEHRNELPALRRITQLYYELERESQNKFDPRCERMWKDELLEKNFEELCTKEMCNKIMDDLKTLDLHYILMDKRQNSRKGK